MLAIERRGFASNLGSGRKAPCRVATTGPVTLSGEQTIDGVAVVADDRVLVKDQTNTVQNAVYACKTGDWELASDFNQRGDVVKGSLIFVTDGTENGLTDWYVATSGRPWPGRQAIEVQRYRPPLSVISGVWAGGQSYDLVADDSSAATKTANTAAIQSAIDYAYANDLQTINIPAGTFYCDPDIYLDPPGNMRSSFGNPAVWQFSLHLKGAGGAGSLESQATILRFTETPTNGLLLVGPGHGMRVSDLNLFAPDPASRAAIATGYVGIGIAGTTGGAHKTLIENVTVWNCRRAFVTGVNGVDVLADSNTFFKCAASNCYTGWHFAKSQNFINSLYDCVSSSKIAILADQGTPVNVIGGNLSLPNALAKAFAISGTSALSATTDSTLGSSHLNYTFTTTIAAGNAALAAGDYDVFTVLTEHFGLVPLQMTNYNSGTSVGTFRFYQPWLASHFNMSGDIDADTDLEAEVRAATTLYAAEQVVTFRGCAVHMTGVHLENQGSVTMLYDHQVGFAGGVQSKIDSLHCNYNVDHGQLYSSTDDHKAVFYGQQVFPFIRHLTPDAASLELSNSWIPGYALGTDGIVIEISGADRQLVVRNTRMRMPNIYVPLIQSYFDGTAASQTRGRGVWDQTPFLPGAEIENSEGAGMAVYLRHRRSALPFLGFMPAPWARPRIRRETITSIEAGPGSIGTYPPLHGGTFYEVDDDLVLGAPSATALVASDHTAWSYGQNLTIDWEYKGHTHVVYLDDTSRMFPGLTIVLDNGSDGDQSYIVTGVYPTLGYITVLELTGNNDKYLYGTQTTVYTGDTVKQEAYAFRRSGTMPASKFTANGTVGVATAAQGDLTGADFVNLKLSAVGSTNYTTRTAAQMFGDIPGCYSGYKYMLAVSNTSTGNTVLAGGSNVTVNSTGNIPASSVRMFEARFTSTAAVTIDGQLST